MTIDNGLRQNIGRLSQDDVRQKKTFSIHLTVPTIGELECYQAFRVIRKKRAVCRARSGQKDFLVKFFFSKQKAKRHWKRNDRGCHIFLDRSIPAPDICFSGYLSDYGIYVIVYEYLQPTVNLKQMLIQEKIPHQSIQFFLRFIEILVLHHKHGIVQYDAHLNNFLISGEKIYSLDGDQIKIFKGEVDKKRSIDNLATFWANLPIACDRYTSECGRTYFSHRGWPFEKNDEKFLFEKIREKRRLFMAKFLSKIYKSRDPFQVISKKNWWAVLDKRNPDLTPASIPNHFTEQFLSGIMSVSISKAPDPTIIPGIKDPIRILTSEGPFWRSNRLKGGLFRRWKNIMMLNRLGIKTSSPLILLKRRTRFFYTQVAFFELESKGVAATDFFLFDDKSQKEKQKLAFEIATYFFVMKQAGLKADKLNLNDFIITKKGSLLTAPDKISPSPKATDAYWIKRISILIHSTGSDDKIISEILRPALEQFGLTNR